MSQAGHKKIIGFDMDGVIIDHSDFKIKLAGERGFKMGKKDVQGDVMEKLLPESVWLEIKKFLYNDPVASLSQPLMSGAKDGLDRIRKSGLPYFLVSRRKDHDMAIKILECRGLWPEYFNRGNAFFVLTREDKNIKAKELGITHYVDDEPSVLEKLTDVKNKFLFDPYEVFTGLNTYERISSWPTLADKFMDRQ